MHYIGILNRDGGTFRTIDLEAFATKAVETFTAHGHTLEPRLVEGRELIAELQRAANDRKSDALLAGGGDGTISAAAGICYAAGMPLAVLPAGTMNLFARSLRLPLNLDQALEALAGGAVQRVDIATANGRPFVHQYSVGMHSRLVRIRNEMPYSGRLTKMLASVRAAGATLSRPLEFDVDILTPQGSETRKATAISISNNPLGEGHVPYAEAVDQGTLGVYIVDPMPPLEWARLAVSLAIGKWKQHPLVEEKQVRQLTLRFRRKKASALAVIDGELVPLDPQVTLKIHAGALKVVAPVEVAAVAA